MKYILAALFAFIVLPAAAIAGNNHCLTVAFWDDDETNGVRMETYNWAQLAKFRPGPDHMRSGGPSPNADKYLKAWLWGVNSVGTQVGFNQWTEPEVLSFGVAGPASADVRTTETNATPATATRHTFGSTGDQTTGTLLSTTNLEKHHANHDITFENVWGFLTSDEKNNEHPTRQSTANTMFSALTRPVSCP